MAQLPLAGIMLRHACVVRFSGLEHVSTSILLWGACLAQFHGLQREANNFR